MMMNRKRHKDLFVYCCWYLFDSAMKFWKLTLGTALGVQSNCRLQVKLVVSVWGSLELGLFHLLNRKFHPKLQLFHVKD